MALLLVLRINFFHHLFLFHSQQFDHSLCHISYLLYTFLLPNTHLMQIRIGVLFNDRVQKGRRIGNFFLNVLSLLTQIELRGDFHILLLRKVLRTYLTSVLIQNHRIVSYLFLRVDLTVFQVKQVTTVLVTLDSFDMMSREQAH